MTTILYADDDPVIRSLVEKTLTHAGMAVVLAADGNDALKVWRNQPVDLIILDIAMPGHDGIQVCRFIRATSNIPMMMLTHRSSEEDIVSGFEAGADDYLVKPYLPKELVARIKAILNRTRVPVNNGQALVNGDLTLNLTLQYLTKKGEIIHITPLEFNLLRYFMQRPGMLLRKEELFENVWGYSLPYGGMNLIEVAIRRLRTKIEDDPNQPIYIQSVRGQGYRFTEFEK